MWVGAILHIKVREETFALKRGPDKGKEVTSRKPEVVEFLGWADGSAVPAAAPTATSAQSSNGSTGFNFDVEAAKATNFIKYVEAATAAGVDPSDERLTKKAFEEARA